MQVAHNSQSTDICNIELETIWRLAQEQIRRAVYSVADLWDFAYGASDLQGRNVEADTHWRNTSSSIEASARLLTHGHMLDAAVQSICLTAEVGVKGAPAALGVDERTRRGLKHPGNSGPSLYSRRRVLRCMRRIKSRAPENRFLHPSGCRQQTKVRRYGSRYTGFPGGFPLPGGRISTPAGSQPPVLADCPGR